MTTTKTTAKDVLIFVPNLIGYSRIACSIGALFLMIAARKYWMLAIILYLASFVGDLFGKWFVVILEERIHVLSLFFYAYWTVFPASWISASCRWTSGTTFGASKWYHMLSFRSCAPLLFVPLPNISPLTFFVNIIDIDIYIWWPPWYGDRPMLHARFIVRSCNWLRGDPPSIGKDRI